MDSGKDHLPAAPLRQAGDLLHALLHRAGSNPPPGIGDQAVGAELVAPVRPLHAMRYRQKPAFARLQILCAVRIKRNKDRPLVRADAFARSLNDFDRFRRSKRAVDEVILEINCDQNMLHTVNPRINSIIFYHTTAASAIGILQDFEKSFS